MRSEADGTEADARLVVLAQRGDQAALGALLERHVGTVRACVARRSGRAARGRQLEDTVQETLVRAIEALPSLRDPDRFGSWLRGIARNVTREEARAPQSAPLETEPAGRSEAEGGPSALAAAVADLPEGQREALLLFYTEGLRYAEIGVRLGITPAAVNRRLTKARAALRGALTSEGRSS